MHMAHLRVSSKMVSLASCVSAFLVGAPAQPSGRIQADAEEFKSHYIVVVMRL